MANQLLLASAHRPGWEAPATAWRWYQEWNKALFLHWKISPGIISRLLPAGLLADTINSDTWVSLVAFTMNATRPRSLVAVPLVSDFHEINLRTYVTDGQTPGVYFLSIEAQKYLSVLVARSFSGLPYQKADLLRTTGNTPSYISRNTATGNYLDVSYTTGDQLPQKTALDTWLTERYAVYHEDNNRLYRYDVHHKEWPLSVPKMINVSVAYNTGPLRLHTDNLNLVHYSEGVEVIAWAKKYIPVTVRK
ncbi:MAG TPA: DUF2071 domain-containing protein [Chitinophaga sp.]|uniref:YqjF family protein n=1 Tax=Chitinophaga sp. TaxID=1869181 RepID=UPI002CACB89B|nr:DUF2071 domain-containing protein [Chitinophaga sp.]HVI48643.1 DUF2071 domain-containing protein [Chitinophaga sp.]